ncbi:MAG TPA: glycosyltransferase [Usitatibacter sp.]|nr:glycosyltransferase [Usitatibacter sp.]
MSAPAAIERLRASPLPRLLFASHAFGGGVGRHVDELAHAVAPRAEVLLLQPHRKSFLALRWLRPGEDLALWLHAADDWERLLEILAGVGVDRVHFHHVHGLPRGILDLPRVLDCAHDLTLHDYFPACPDYHLTGADGRYCGGDPGCRHCTDGHPAQWGLSVEAWRAAFGTLLAAAGRVIAPSGDAAARIQAFFPDVTPVVWPHPETGAAPAAPPVRVLVPGAISKAKGLDLLEACVRDAARRALPLHFRVLGYLSRPIPAWPELPFSLAGEYREGDLAALVALERGDAFFFPAQCPETFSYTLSAALATALPIVATDLGALPERLAGRANARVVRWDSPASAVNDAILGLAPPAAARAAGPSPSAVETYASAYAAPLPPASRGPRARVPPLEARWLAAPDEDIGQWTLAALFDDAVGCGRASSREKLREHAARADARLAEMASELSRMRAEAGRHEAPPAPSGADAPAPSPLRSFARWLRRGA